MKPTSLGETLPPKISLTKSLKKARSKVSKSNLTVITQQAASTHLVYNPASAEYFKGNQRAYSGFGPKTIKVFWEQHDTSDTDVMPEVFTSLAEDVTYKLWDLINTVKTYTRHSGGRVTCDIVNEVLKDCNADPVLGSVDKPWNKVEYDGSFYFNTDEDVDLREEYLKEIECNAVTTCRNLNTYWSVDHHHSQSLFEFSSTLCSAIFLGDDETFKYALDIAASISIMGCVCKILLKKCIEILAFEQTSKATVRCMEFLRFIAANPFSRDVDCRDQLFHLAELFTCLIAGSIDTEPKTESFEFVKNFLESSETHLKKDSDALNPIDVDDIRNAYEALFQMMARDGFQERGNADASSTIDDLKTEPQESIVEDLKIEQLEEAVSMVTDAVNTNNLEQQPDESNCTQKCFSPLPVEYSPYKTEMIADEHLDSVYFVLGSVSSQFGYLKNECTFLFEKRLEKFFCDRLTIDETDYKKLMRIVCGLVTLGEKAFREILPYLNKINPFTSPECINIAFNPSAIFLHGRQDIFLYEWLETLCGDKLQPFMLHYYHYVDIMTQKRYRSHAKSTFKIMPKIELTCIEKKSSKTSSYHACFDSEYLRRERKLVIKWPLAKTIQVKEKNSRGEKRTKVFQIEAFNKKVVIVRRRMLKSLTNTQQYRGFSNYGLLQL